MMSFRLKINIAYLVTVIIILNLTGRLEGGEFAARVTSENDYLHDICMIHN